MAGDEFVVQLIDTLFCVYELRTLTKVKNLGMWTIGLPVAEHYDYDTAVMTALLSQ